MASSGVHSNGYSLVRHILATTDLTLESRPAELDRPLGEVLLTPTRIYAKDCLALSREGGMRAFAHITGGGLAANLARSLPPTADAVLDRSSWEVPAIFRVLQARGDVPQAEMDKTFNLGVGMAAIVAPDATRRRAAAAGLARRAVVAARRDHRRHRDGPPRVTRRSRDEALASGVLALRAARVTG